MDVPNSIKAKFKMKQEPKIIPCKVCGVEFKKKYRSLTCSKECSKELCSFHRATYRKKNLTSSKIFKLEKRMLALLAKFHVLHDRAQKLRGLDCEPRLPNKLELNQ